jgi:FKBP-type peptidyl-prolyl cis-trans isomerase 2
MKKAEDGNTVKVHYTGKLDDGTVFDSSRDSDPLEFTVGSGHVIKGFDEAISGMEVGEQKTVNITAAEAYGPVKEEMVLTIKRDQLPKNIELKEGLHLQLTQPNGAIFNVMVTNLAEDSVTLDGNHPLAGKDLNFDIELVEVK